MTVLALNLRRLPHFKIRDHFVHSFLKRTIDHSPAPLQPLLVVTFDTGHCALSLHTLHAQLFLLSQAALRRELAEDPLFQRLLSKWFLNELGEMNHMEILTPRRGCSLESEILPDYLKPHLLRSGVPSIVNKGERGGACCCALFFGKVPSKDF